MGKTMNELVAEEKMKKQNKELNDFIAKLDKMTVLRLAMSLETDLIHAATTRNDMSVYEYLKNFEK